jgi:molybdenum cofactor biosynthesis protein B
MPNVEHRSQVVATVRCAVITVSDTRTSETDRSGEAISASLRDSGHVISSREIIRDEPAEIGRRLGALCADSQCDAVLISGGTGLGARDSTYEAVTPLFEKRLDGFGELFRMLSYEEIGPAAMLSRATAGAIGTKLVFLMPGSPAAVKLAMDRLILPVIGHAVHLLGASSVSSRHGGSETSSRG